MRIYSQKKSRHSFILLWTVLILITILEVAHCDLIPNPQNEVARLSENVVLKCKSTLGYPLTWQIMKPGSSSKCEIFDGYHLIENVNNVSSYCKVVNGLPGKYELSLKATKDAAQRYICLEPGTLIEASAEVIIIKSDPECNVTSDGEFAIFTCSLRFYGNWAPVMEWRNTTSDEVIRESVYTTLVPNESLTSRLVMLANQSFDSKMYYMCITKFRMQEKPSHTTADNIPTYYNKATLSAEYIAVYTAEDKMEDRTEKIILGTCIPVFLVAIATVGGVAAFLKSKRRNKKLNCNENRQNPEENETLTDA